MKISAIKQVLLLLFTILTVSCTRASTNRQDAVEIVVEQIDTIPLRNRQVVDTIVKYGAQISPTYKKAVCTELVIPIVEKFHPLSRTDKNRIRIITDGDIQTMLREDSPVPKGVYYALIEKGIGEAVKTENVLPGDFVQFWTDTWGHCGVVKSIDPTGKTMELYSSFPSTDGYGIQRFNIPDYCFFVRMMK